MYLFASDMHLGSGNGPETSLDRERRLVNWLDTVGRQAKGIYLVGDVFDFWFEYKKVIPKGFARLIGKLAELTDSGVEIHLFMGNHDMWMRNYLEQECGVRLHRRPGIEVLHGKRVYISHGNEITERGNHIGRILYMVFHSSTLRWLFSRLVHPTCAIRIGQWWSNASRNSQKYNHTFEGEREPLIQFARDTPEADYFVFGHIHVAVNYDLGDERRAIFLGDWFGTGDYAVLSQDGTIELGIY